jgi:TRAP-type mannitol/chloroaromatic compound transport system permease small subunit
MAFVLSLSRAIDRLTAWIGTAAGWLVLAAVLLSAGNAIVRKTFDYSSNAFLEAQWYLFGAVFMLAAAYTLQRNEHVRIDVLSAGWSKRTRDWIDLAGHVLVLAPFVGLMASLSWPFFLSSFRSGEVSASSGGLVLWPAKGLVFAGFALLCLQAVSEIIKKALALAGVTGAETALPEPAAAIAALLPDDDPAHAGKRGAPQP